MIFLSYVNISDCHALETDTWEAEFSVNGGNNVNWNISAGLVYATISNALADNFYATRSFPVLDANLIDSNVDEDDYSAWAIGTTYGLGDRVIIAGTTHNVYESLQAGNVGNDPLDDLQAPNGTPVYWILVSKTNRWKMFDNSNTSQTINADSIEVEIDLTQRPNAIFFSNVEASDIQVIMEDSLGNLVYKKRYLMVENTGAPSYYSWFLTQIERKTDLFINDLPPFGNATIKAYINNNGADAKCGTMVIGFAEALGKTTLGASVGIQDFSVKQRNDFGDFQVLERAFNKRGEFTIFTENSNIDRLQNTLASYRATPTVYIGTSKYDCTYIYGFYRDFNIVIQYLENSLVSIEVEGLT